MPAVASFLIRLLLPPATVTALGFAAIQYYKKGVKGYKRKLENDLRDVVAHDRVNITPEMTETAGRRMHKAHLYYDIHKKCFQLTLAGSLSWLGAYVPLLTGGELTQILFSSSLTGLPAETGLIILSGIAWLIAGVFIAILVLAFGHDPEEISVNLLDSDLSSLAEESKPENKTSESSG